MTKKKTWDAMSAREREAAVRTLMAAGGSNVSVAKELGASSGAIAGLRFKKGIPSTNKVPSMGKPKENPPPDPTPPPTPSDAGRAEPIRHKMAATEATQCYAHDEEGRRCAYERMPGSDYCRLPQHQALTKNPARR